MRDHRLACETIASRRVPSSSRDGLSRIRAIYISGQDFETYIARMRDGFSLQCGIHRKQTLKGSQQCVLGARVQIGGGYIIINTLFLFEIQSKI